jgi:hypothetical protein
MIIHVGAFAYFRDILGKDLWVEIKDKSTIKELLDGFLESHQKLKSALFDESGKVQEHVFLMKISIQ